MRTTGTEFLKRTFSLLTLLGQMGSPKPLRTIAQVAELPKPSAHRLLNMLKQLGYVDTEVNGDYYLTSQIHNLIPANRDASLMALALPIMDKIYAELNETTNLAYLDGQRIKYAHIMESTKPLRWSPQPVTHQEVLTTALGRAIFAFLPDTTRKSMLPVLLERVKKTANYNEESTSSLVKNIRRQKIAYDLEENCEGAICFGIPLLKDRLPIGSISVTVPTPRLDASFRKHVIQVLKDIDNNLGETQN